jgi:hypothetical protein
MVLVVPQAPPDLDRRRSSDDDYDDDDDNDRPRRRSRYEDDEDDRRWGDLHPSFRYDKFLMRQKLFTVLTEKYNVQNERGRPLMFIERPAMFVQGCVATGTFTLILMAGVVGGIILAEEVIQGPAGIVAGFVVGAVALVLAVLVMFQLMPRRHITFYADESKSEPLMRVLQDQKLFLINAWYTLVDDEGKILARFRKNYLYNIFRKRWYIYDPEEQPICVVMEDSLLLSILRRTVGTVLEDNPLFGLAFAGVFRTNFIFTRVEDERILGEFNRRFTILDRYVLDMTKDPSRIVDRRIASAMGVLLDTGEGR